ncbi:phosphoribosylformylglycinamidine synthase subunit PurS [Haladaptatus sp. F3-133]|jgi:phosphoribosylformylglycinamidine synthase|uniref:Phosphoribosylformylglycinamidine synthase subunit PurS n=1 Tax=Halorutilus salinus TaxID=2487751 RepID=A0A9Q4GHM7_9EURY|nr:phosphoribosylformylglycinamidine synthase subunit PurS [Halorutilus salinus]MCX2817958.1 phosphoribosylformylglycinamidine synthase subunit PurS [Halorutilus salinus]
MTYEAVVRVTLKGGVLDPEAKTIQRSLNRLGFGVENLRTADEYVVEIDAVDENEAREQAEEMCERLLANPTIHDYTVEVRET